MIDQRSIDKTRNIITAIVDSLNEVAQMMEEGEIPTRNGPDALRGFAASLRNSLSLVAP